MFQRWKGLNQLNHRVAFGYRRYVFVEDIFKVEIVDPCDHIHHCAKLDDHKSHEKYGVAPFLVVDLQHDIGEICGGLQSEQREIGIPNGVEEVKVVYNRVRVQLPQISVF